MKRPFASSILVCLSILVFASVAVADPVTWTDWTSAIVGASGSAQGTLNIGPTPVDVSYSGAISFAQTSGGTNYWNPSAPYISSTVGNAPPASDIIALSTGGTATITFSQAVQDPLVALVSWNGNTVDFNDPIQFLSYGQGYWGNGTPIINADGDGFFGSGEVHGVLQLTGSYTSISFTHTSEGWHGFTIGTLGPAGPVGVPEPATMLLLGAGLIGLAGFGRRKLR